MYQCLLLPETDNLEPGGPLRSLLEISGPTSLGVTTPCTGGFLVSCTSIAVHQWWGLWPNCFQNQASFQCQREVVFGVQIGSLCLRAELAILGLAPSSVVKILDPHRWPFLLHTSWQTQISLDNSQGKDIICALALLIVSCTLFTGMKQATSPRPWHSAWFPCRKKAVWTLVVVKTTLLFTSVYIIKQHTKRFFASFQPIKYWLCLRVQLATKEIPLLVFPDERRFRSMRLRLKQKTAAAHP